MSKKSKLVADNSCILLVPEVVTDCPPDTIVVDFNTTLHWGAPTHQPDCKYISVVYVRGK